MRTEISEEHIATIIRVIRIREKGLTLAVCTMYFFATCVGCSLLLTLFLAHPLLSPWWWRSYIPAKHRFLQEPHVVTSQKTAYFIVTAVKTSNLTPLTLYHGPVSFSLRRVSAVVTEWKIESAAEQNWTLSRRKMSYPCRESNSGRPDCSPEAAYTVETTMSPPCSLLYTFT
jgi:hypothetical protein